MMLLPVLLLATAADKPAKPIPAKPAATKPKPAAKPAGTKPKPKQPDIAPLSHDEKDGFGVLQVAVPDAAEFISGWKLGAGGKSATTRTVADKPLFTFLIFRGCKADAAGNCDVVADFVIHRPDATINDENKQVVVWNKTAPTDAKRPYLGDGALGYGVDDEGPFGDYRIVATVTDRVAGITLTTEQTLTIASGKAALAKPTAPAAPRDTSKLDPAKLDPITPDPATPDAAPTPDPATPVPAEPAAPPAK